jgi:hypothetical protein
LRNSYGVGSFVRVLLARPSSRTESVRYDGEIGPGVRVGADLRLQFLQEQFETEEVRTVIRDSVPVQDTTLVSKSRTGYHMMAAALYAAFEPARDVTFYLRYDPENEGVEAYGLLERLWGSLYLKVGAFTPDFGLRLDDHTAYVRGGDLGYLHGLPRRGLFFGPTYRDAGAELGFDARWWRLSAAYLNGNGGGAPFGEDKVAFLRLEVRPTLLGIRTLLGTSLHRQAGRSLYGFFGGLSRGRLTFLGELDYADSLATVDPSKRIMAFMLEGSLRLMRGVHLVGRFDLWDPDRDFPGESFKRLVLGGELFLLPYLEVRPQLRLNMEPGSVLNPTVRNNQFLVQLHLYL